MDWSYLAGFTDGDGFPYLVLKQDRAREVLLVLDEVHSLKEQYGNKYRVHLRAVAA